MVNLLFFLKTMMISNFNDFTHDYNRQTKPNLQKT